MKLILGSGSPRRQQLLQQLGVVFTSDAPDVDESLLADESPVEYVLRLAVTKARAVVSRHPGSVVLGADTTVFNDGNILGKPRSKEDGMAMLEALSGATHEVVSGVAIVAEREEVFSVISKVTFRRLDAAEIDWYWETGEPADKAGGYGLQGAGGAFVETIEGSYSNVIGLPLAETVRVLRGFDIECLGQGAVSEKDSNNPGQM